MSSWPVIGNGKLESTETIAREKMANQRRRICVFTYVYGGYESVLHEPAPGGIEADYICLTDRESRLSAAPDTVWSVHLVEPRLLRYPKVLPEHKALYFGTTARALPVEIFDRNSYDILIYVDANISLSDNALLGEMIQTGTRQFAELVFSMHPLRDCVYEEAAASIYHKYANNDFASQMSSYREQGCPEHVGLYWNGLCVFLDPFGDRTIAFGQRYRDECLNSQWAKDPLALWHPQGQVVLSKVLFEMGALPLSDRKANALIRVADFPAAYGLRCQAYVHAPNR